MTMVSKFQEMYASMFARGQCYGKQAAASNLEEDSTLPFVLTAGVSGAFGSEVALHDGTVLEGGDVTKRFRAGRWVIADASAAAKSVYIVSFWGGFSDFAHAFRLTSFYYITPSDKSSSSAVNGIGGALPCSLKLWAQCKCSADSETISLLFEGMPLNP